jgi:hypothetical protein
MAQELPEQINSMAIAVNSASEMRKHPCMIFNPPDTNKIRNLVSDKSQPHT